MNTKFSQDIRPWVLFCILMPNIVRRLFNVPATSTKICAERDTRKDFQFGAGWGWGWGVIALTNLRGSSPQWCKRIKIHSWGVGVRERVPPPLDLPEFSERKCVSELLFKPKPKLYVCTFFGAVTRLTNDILHFAENSPESLLNKCHTNPNNFLEFWEECISQRVDPCSCADCFTFPHVFVKL